LDREGDIPWAVFFDPCPMGARVLRVPCSRIVSGNATERIDHEDVWHLSLVVGLSVQSRSARMLHANLDATLTGIRDRKANVD
jgi:hypothetical protein